MDIAIVTGASSSLGQAISRRLIDIGFRVYGLGGDYSQASLQNRSFIPISCDLANPGEVDEHVARIIQKETAVSLLVNNAKVYPTGLLEDLTGPTMERAFRINFFTPLVILRRLLPGLKMLQGQVINLGPIQSETAHGGLIGASSAGAMRWLGEALFREYRDSGLRVCQISPEPNRNRSEEDKKDPYNRKESAINPERIAEAVEQVVQHKGGNAITELVVQPQRTKELSLDPVLKLPNPEPKPIPYTVPREWIEAEEHLDDEDAEKMDPSPQPDARKSESKSSDSSDGEAPKRKRRRRGGRRGRGRGDESKEGADSNEADSDSTQDKSPKEEPKPARGGETESGSRRPPRNRGRQSKDRDSSGSGQDAASSTKSQSSDGAVEQKPHEDKRHHPSREATGSQGGGDSEGQKRRRRRGRKPRPPKLETPAGIALSEKKAQTDNVGKGDKPSSSGDSQRRSGKDKDQGAKDSGNASSEKSQGAKKAAKKAARKATKKAVKKATPQKSASKPASEKSTEEPEKRATKKTSKKKVASKAGATKKTARKTVKKVAKKKTKLTDE